MIAVIWYLTSRFLDLESYIKKEINNLFLEKLHENKLKSKNIQNPKVFDAYFYAMFRVFYKRLRDKGKIQLILKFIGKKIYDHLKRKNKISGNIKKDLTVIQNYFKKNRFFINSQISWTDKKRFKQTINGMVNYDACKEIYNELGFSANIISRVMESYFNEYKIKVFEKHFNPYQHNKKVIEFWEFK
ncbi:MAG: hypothetical protein KatS3mg002_0495 [Candidatus Woesearchaeota archaeon]|nr:MAG: hypothetical protein KatS3mg002_0495 [Candidatus Woesearchaeota archaeon]